MAVADQPLGTGPAGGHAGHEQPGQRRPQGGAGPVPRVQRVGHPEDHAELDADRQQQGDPPAEHRARRQAGGGPQLVQVGGVVGEGRCLEARREEHDGDEREDQVAKAPVAEHDDPGRHGERSGHRGGAAQRVGLAQRGRGAGAVLVGQAGRDELHDGRRAEAEQGGADHRGRPPARAEQERAGADEAEGRPAEDHPTDRRHEPGADHSDAEEAGREERGVERDLRPVDVELVLQRPERGAQTVQEEADQAEQPVEGPGVAVAHEPTAGCRCAAVLRSGRRPLGPRGVRLVAVAPFRVTRDFVRRLHKPYCTP